VTTAVDTRVSSRPRPRLHSPGLPALVVGTVSHQRPGPVRHGFSHEVYQWLVDLPHSYVLAALVSALVIALAVVAVAIGAARGRLAGKLRWALVMFGVPPTPARSGNTEGESGPDPVDRGLHALLTGPRGRIAAAFGLHVGARLLLAAEIYAGLQILGVRVGVMATLIFIAIPIGLSVIGTFVPGQIGLQEGASALVAAALGIGPATGIALVFLQRLRQLVFVPLAGLLIALLPYGPRTSDPPGTS